MAKHLYNGIELPALPDWDKVAYPYAVISDYAYDSEQGVNYSLAICSTAPVWHTTSLSNGAIHKLYSDGDSIKYICKTNEHNEWVDGSEYNLVIASHTENKGIDYGYSVFPVWANTDVVDYNGNPLVPASEPVPVPEPTIVLTDSDLYYKVNGQPVKLTLYKKVGGELVAYDDYIKEVSNE